MSRLIDDLKFIESLPLAPVFGRVSAHDEAEYKPDQGGAEELMKILQTRYHIHGDGIHCVRILCPGGGVLKADSRSDAEWVVAELNGLLDEVARLNQAIKVVDGVIKRLGEVSYKLVMDGVEAELDQSPDWKAKEVWGHDGSEQSWEEPYDFGERP